MTTDKESNAELTKDLEDAFKSRGEVDRRLFILAKVRIDRLQSELETAEAKIEAQQKVIRDDLAAAIESIVGHLVSEHNTQKCPKSCAVCFFIDLGKAAIAAAEKELPPKELSDTHEQVETI